MLSARAVALATCGTAKSRATKLVFVQPDGDCDEMAQMLAEGVRGMQYDGSEYAYGDVGGGGDVLGERAV